MDCLFRRTFFFYMPWYFDFVFVFSRPLCRITHLYTQHQVPVSVLHLPLSALQLLGSLLLPLQLPDVVHRGFQNGALIPAHVSGVCRRQRSTVRVSWLADQLTRTARDSLQLLWAVMPSHIKHTRTHEEQDVDDKANEQTDKHSHTQTQTVSTHGSFDLGIKVPSSLMRSLMLNLRLRSTSKWITPLVQLISSISLSRFNYRS